MSLVETDCNGNIQHCGKLKRIIKTVKLCGTATEKQILSHATQYTSIIDDFHHILIAHNNQMESIYDHMEFRCDLSNCNKFSKMQHKSNDISTVFLVKLLDQIHCYFMHQFDTGFRLRPSLLVNDEEKSNTQQIIAVDQQFEQMSKLLNKKRQENFLRISKFNIAPIVANTSDNKDIPFISLMSNDMKKIKGYIQQTPKLLKYLHEQEYDSDAIKYDIYTQGTKKNSNILNYFPNTKFALSLNKYVKNHFYGEIYGIFSTGYSFWYWPYYKKSNKLTQYVTLGNQSTKLYVAAKYANLKNELLCNTTHPLQLLHYKTAMHKATKYVQTQAIKKMKSNEKLDIIYHYGIQKGSVIRIGHVLSIILYTDYTELSRKFTESFRSITRNEKLSLIKQRNAVFANWGRLLRECIELYGNKIDKAEGMSFYCGMSPLLLQSFLIRLNGPTSTTTAQEIAINFAKDSGIIIELREANVLFGTRLKYFDSHLLSSYPEQERTFFGGAFPIRVYSIKLRVEGKWNNLQRFCQALSHFETMINGGKPRGTNDTKTDNFIINKLIEGLLEDKDNERLPEYINRLFSYFCNERNVIILNTDFIKKIFKNLKGNIFYKGGNVLNLERLTRIFPNVCTLKINDDQCTTTENKFDVSQFVSCCSKIFNTENNKLKEIILLVKRARDRVSNKYIASWLYDEYTNIVNIDEYSPKIIISHHLKSDTDVLSICFNE